MPFERHKLTLKGYPTRTYWSVERSVRVEDIRTRLESAYDGYTDVQMGKEMIKRHGCFCDEIELEVIALPGTVTQKCFAINIAVVFVGDDLSKMSF